MKDAISPEFFRRRALELCPRLLGMQLCRRMENGEIRRLPITEVEAYTGFQDRASHAHRGRTSRNSVMFGPGGNWYVYLCYGVHWLLNLVTGPEDYPEAVLIRGAGKTSGPGRLTRELKIDRSWDGCPVHPRTGLWLEPRCCGVRGREVRRTPRVGIDSAGSPWTDKPWRFVWESGQAEPDSRQ